MTKNVKNKNAQIKELSKTLDYDLLLSILCLYSHDGRTKFFCPDLFTKSALFRISQDRL